MRLVFGLLVALAVVAAPASAQQRFVQACAASPDVQQIDGLDAAQLCGCIAEETVARGIPAADLDRSIDYGPDDIATAPEEIRAVAEVATESTVGCALAQEVAREAYEDGVADAASVTGSPETTAVTGVPAVPQPVPTVDTGLRTGDGTGSVRVEQEGKGGAIRIVGN